MSVLELRDVVKTYPGPVEALRGVTLAVRRGEVVQGERTKLVRVEPGLFADGLVEITGEGIREGTRVVVVPA